MAKSIKELEEETNVRFKSLEDNILKVVELVSKAQETPAQAQVTKTAETEAKSAEPNNAYLEPVHPEWLADAKTKIGEKLDHCEVDYPKNGFPRYTVVIKSEFSNASKSHLDFYKIDRRTVAVINGFESVKTFNSLVAQNLKLNPKKLD